MYKLDLTLLKISHPHYLLSYMDIFLIYDVDLQCYIYTVGWKIMCTHSNFLDVFSVGFFVYSVATIFDHEECSQTYGPKQQLKTQATHEGSRLGMPNIYLKPNCVGPCFLLVL